MNSVRGCYSAAALAATSRAPAGGAGAGGGRRQRCLAGALLRRATSGSPARGDRTAGRRRPGRLRETVRHLAGRFQLVGGRGALGARRVAGVPDRPFPRQGGHRTCMCSFPMGCSRRCGTEHVRGAVDVPDAGHRRPRVPRSHRRGAGHAGTTYSGRRRGGDGAAGGPDAADLQAARGR